MMSLINTIFTTITKYGHRSDVLIQLLRIAESKTNSMLQKQAKDAIINKYVEWPTIFMKYCWLSIGEKIIQVIKEKEFNSSSYSITKKTSQTNVVDVDISYVSSDEEDNVKEISTSFKGDEQYDIPLEALLEGVLENMKSNSSKTTFIQLNNETTRLKNAYSYYMSGNFEKCIRYFNKISSQQFRIRALFVTYLLQYNIEKAIQLVHEQLEFDILQMQDLIHPKQEREDIVYAMATMLTLLHLEKPIYILPPIFCHNEKNLLIVSDVNENEDGLYYISLNLEKLKSTTLKYFQKVSTTIDSKEFVIRLWLSLNKV